MIEHKGNNFYGTVKVGERGQIVIPKKVREKYGIKPGESLIVFGDNNKVIKLIKEDLVKDLAIKLLETLDNESKVE